MLEIRNMNDEIINFQDIRFGDMIKVKLDKYPEKIMVVATLIDNEKLKELNNDFSRKTLGL